MNSSTTNGYSHSVPDTEDLAAPLREGTVIGEKYRIRRPLARGGTAVVYEAEHVQLGQRCAVKVLDPSPSSVTSSGAWNRLLVEARSAAQLSSEHAVRVFDVGITEGQQPFIVMELLVGHDLARELEEKGAMPIDGVAALVLQACHALAEAHAVGLVHRDIKPSNLFVTKRSDGSPYLKVLDFGLAHRSIGPMDTAGRRGGSPGYASPEQLGAHENVDERADVWGLGVVLYELVKGHRPFEADTLASSLLSSVLHAPPPLTSPHGLVAPAFESVVRKCLQSDRELRFVSVAELADALAPFAAAAWAHYPARIRERSADPLHETIQTTAPASMKDRPTFASHVDAPSRTTRGSEEAPSALLTAEVVTERSYAAWFVALTVLAIAGVGSALSLQSRSGRQSSPPASASVLASSTTSSARLLLPPLPPLLASASPSASPSASANVSTAFSATTRPALPATAGMRSSPRVAATGSTPASRASSTVPNPMTYR